MLDTKKRIENRTLYISLIGRLDSNSVAFFEDELRSMYDDVDCIVFDMTDLEHISSAGLRVLLKAKKSVDSVVIKNSNKVVRDVFEITGFDKMLDLQ